MLLTTWAGREGHGAYALLRDRTKELDEHGKGVSYKTVLKAAKHGEPVQYEIAELLSAATVPLGGTAPECSIDEIRFPGRHRVRAKRVRRSAA